MKVRSTENDHKFTKDLFKEINAFDIQGLTLNKNKTKFIAGLEAIEIDDKEFSLKILFKLFKPYEIFAKCLLTETLNIPLFILTHNTQGFSVYQVDRLNKTYNITYKLEYIDLNKDISYKSIKINMNTDEFLDWWKTIKETVQNKDFKNGADKRAALTCFDKVLMDNGYMWGGNLDGFIIKDNKIVAVIDNLSAGTIPIENYNPIETKWFSAWILHANSLLAQKLDVPHLLFTIDKYHPQNEIIGLSVFEKLNLYKQSKDVTYLNNISPNKNIIKGISTIKNSIYKDLNLKPPIITKTFK